MSNNGRVLLQLRCQPLQERLRAYVLSGGNAGPLSSAVATPVRSISGAAVRMIPASRAAPLGSSGPKWG